MLSLKRESLESVLWSFWGRKWLGLGDIRLAAKISKYRVAHLDFNGKLHFKPDLFSSLFFIWALLLLPKIRFHFLHFLQGKNAQNRPEYQQNLMVLNAITHKDPNVRVLIMMFAFPLSLLHICKNVNVSTKTIFSSGKVTPQKIVKMP